MNFLSTMLAAFIGACLSPVITSAIQDRNSRLKLLSDAHNQVTLLLVDYIKHTTYVLSLIRRADSFREDKNFYLEYSKRNVFNAKFITELYSLLDFHLSYGLEKIVSLRTSIMSLSRHEADAKDYILGVTETRVEKSEVDQLLYKVSDYISEVQKWCKAEKNKLGWREVIRRWWQSILSTCQEYKKNTQP